jgi:hypothetical protein
MVLHRCCRANPNTQSEKATLDVVALVRHQQYRVLASLVPIHPESNGSSSELLVVIPFEKMRLVAVDERRETSEMTRVPGVHFVRSGPPRVKRYRYVTFCVLEEQPLFMLNS